MSWEIKLEDKGTRVTLKPSSPGEKKARDKVQPGEQVLLMGPPNVGKSVIFNRLTGMDVSVANYTGTTVEFTRGTASLGKTFITLVDVPGTYTLDATNQAEEVALEMLGDNPSAIICVVDAGNLEGSLYHLLQVMEQGKPLVVALNRSDLAREKGYIIDDGYLSRELGVPVIPLVAVTGQGIDLLAKVLEGVIQGGATPVPRWPATAEGRWKKAEGLVREAQVIKGVPLLKRKQWGEWLVQPWPGLPLAAFIMLVILGLVTGLGMGLRRFLLLPLFRELAFPYLVLVVESLVPPGILQNILVGEYGFLIKGLEWPFALVMPYVISFYLVLSLLEDSGYLPRLGALLDGILNKIGLQGSSVVPLLLGLGCGIPGILATRGLNSQKERLVVSSLICLAVPCVAQTGAFISLLAERSLLVVVALFLLSGLALVTAGLVLDYTIKGPAYPTLMEIPDLLYPSPGVILKKMWGRLKRFVVDGALPMVGAVALAALLYETGAMEAWGRLLSPLVTGWLRLPQEAAVPLALGILRRELAVLPLLDMDLTTLQLFTGAAVGLFYVPCIAMIAVLAREFRLATATGVLLLTTAIAFFLGGVIARVGGLF